MPMLLRGNQCSLSLEDWMKVTFIHLLNQRPRYEDEYLFVLFLPFLIFLSFFLFFLKISLFFLF